uniref:Uncharacterized protein n=1 Tax=Oryza meridionalis TaxID=40149 RepID=A0A0E0DKS4_9ORYZ
MEGQQQQLASLAGDGDGGGRGVEAGAVPGEMERKPPPPRGLLDDLASALLVLAGRGSRRWFRCSAHPNALIDSGGGLIRQRCWPSRPRRRWLRKGKDGGWKGIFVSLPIEETKMISKIYKRAKMEYKQQVRSDQVA